MGADDDRLVGPPARPPPDHVAGLVDADAGQPERREAIAHPDGAVALVAARRGNLGDRHLVAHEGVVARRQALAQGRQRGEGVGMVAGGGSHALNKSGAAPGFGKW